eukprot:s68_g10.t1
MGISREAAKELTRLAWPSVLALVLDQATGLTTLFFVAALDDEYLLGSVGLGAMAQNVFGFSLGMGVNSALSTLVSQGNGAGRLDLCNLALQQAQLLSLLVAVPSMFIMMYTGAFFEAVGINQRSARDAGEYVRGTIFVMPFHFLSCATRLFLRAMKLPRPPTYVSLVVSLLHPIWCYLLLHRLGAGAFGAGLTVSISYGLYFALLTAYVAVVRPAPCDVAWTPLPLDLARRRLCSCMKRFNADARAIEAEPGFREYLHVALPSAILMWTEWWVYEAMSLLAGLCGKTALAAHTATCSWLLIIFMVPSGLGSATSAAVGHAIGAGQSEAARSSMKAGVALILGSCSVLGLLLFLGRGLAGRLFSSDEEVLAAMNVLIIILVVFQLFDGIQTVLEGGLIGLGLQRGASQVKLVSMVVVRLGGAYVLAIALHVGVSGIWIAGVLGMLVTVCLYIRLLRRCDFELLASSAQQQLEPVEDAFLQRYGGRLLGGVEAERSQDADPTDSQNFTPILFANCLIIGLSAALGGYDHGAASGALQNLVALRGLKRQGRLGPLLQGWVVASAWASNIAGNLGGYYMPTPRLALIVAGFLEAIGSLLTALAPQLWVLILGRLVNGFGLGLNGVAVSQYISEIAPPNARGGAIAVQETTFVSGAFIGALVGQHFLRLKDGWRTTWGLASPLGLLAVLTMLRMPDTPRSIYRRAARTANEQRSESPEAAQRRLMAVLEAARREALSTMCQIRGFEFADAAMLQELDGIERTYISELNLLGRAGSSAASPSATGSQEWWQEELPISQIFKSPVHLRLLLAGCAANTLPALSGSEALLNYAGQMFHMVGFGYPDAASLAVSMYGVKLVMAFPSFLWLDSVGRRVLLSYGLSGVTASYGVAALGLGLHSPTLAGIGLMASQAIYQGAVGPVTWIVSSEMYPSDMRARGCAIAAATFSTFTLLSVQFHPLLISRGHFTVLAMYALSAQAAWLLTRVTVPETKGRTLEEIQDEAFDGRLFRRTSIMEAGSIFGLEPAPDAAGSLWEEGGIRRLYQGVQLAIIQAPLSRLGDTAANAGVLVLMDFYFPEAPLPLKTAAASTAAALWRIALTPIDTLKTTYQVRGEGGLDLLLARVRRNGPGELYAGAIANFAGNWVGNYPYFVVFNALDSAWTAPSDPMMRIVRTGLMGMCSSISSDTLRGGRGIPRGCAARYPARRPYRPPGPWLGDPALSQRTARNFFYNHLEVGGREAQLVEWRPALAQQEYASWVWHPSMNPALIASNLVEA